MLLEAPHCLCFPLFHLWWSNILRTCIGSIRCIRIMRCWLWDSSRLVSHSKTKIHACYLLRKDLFIAPFVFLLALVQRESVHTGFIGHELHLNSGLKELISLHHCWVAFSLGRLREWFSCQIRDKAFLASLGFGWRGQQVPSSHWTISWHSEYLSTHQFLDHKCLARPSSLPKKGMILAEWLWWVPQRDN